jgi:adenylate kinase
MALIVVFLGAPGAGKGTQATMVAQKLNLAHISSGDLFRRAVESGDELGLKVKTYMNKGALVPDEITTQMVLKRIKQIGQKGAILDGFPRNLSQAEFLDSALLEEKRFIDSSVYIKVAEKELLRRLSSRWLCRRCQAPYNCSVDMSVRHGKCLSCGGELYQRPDDNAETVKKRLDVYFKETAPLIEYYRKRGKLAEIDGEGDVAQIKDRILGVLSGQK